MVLTKKGESWIVTTVSSSYIFDSEELARAYMKVYGKETK